MSPKNCQARLSAAPNNLTIAHLSGSFGGPTTKSDNFDKGSSAMMPPLYSTPRPPLHLHLHTHSSPTSTASLRTVPTVLLRLQHHATATNHRFRLVKRVRPTAFGTLPPRPDSPSPPPPPPHRTPGAVLIQPLFTATAPCRCPELRRRLEQRIRLLEVFHVWPFPTACVLQYAASAASAGFKTQQLNVLREGNGRGRGKCRGTQQLTTPDATINHNKIIHN